MHWVIFANLNKKPIDLFLCFLFLRIHSNAEKFICADTFSIVLILCEFKMKYSIGMQWTHTQQKLLIYIIILLYYNLKILFDKQNAKFNIHLLCPNKQRQCPCRVVFVTIRLGVYVKNFLVVSCLSPKPSITDFWLLLTPLEVNIAYL